jgi:hypothetical protein
MLLSSPVNEHCAPQPGLFLVCEDQPVGQESISTKPVQRVREAVGKRLSSEGWTLVEQKLFDPPGVGTFALPLRDGFVATFVVVDDLLEDESGALTLSPVGLMGLDYEPARRITTALTGVARSGVVLKQPSLAVGLPDAGEAAEAADSLVDFAAEQAPSLTDLADVDTLIEMLRQRSAVPSVEPMAVLRGDEPIVPPPGYPELPDPVPELVAALLAGAGRHDEARRALAECEQPDPEGGRENARFVRQLTRWVDHAGKIALPETPAQWPPHWPLRAFRSQPPSSFGQFMAENMPEIRARREAVRAVRAVSTGKSRDELRSLLRSELGSREVGMPPVTFEQTIESLAAEQEPFGKARLAVRGLRALWDMGHTGSPQILSVFSDQPSEPEDEPDPSWMNTPERAAYPIRLSGHDRVAVTLDPAAAALLDGVMPKGMVQNRNIEVWFISPSEPRGSASRVSVHIGSKRIGELDAETTERYRPVLEAAGERDEDPWADAHLTRIPGATPCVLDVPLPEVSDP